MRDLRPITFPTNRAFKLELVVKGRHVTVLIDDAIVCETEDADNNHPAGHIALGCRKQSTVQFGAVEVMELPPEAE